MPTSSPNRLVYQQPIGHSLLWLIGLLALWLVYSSAALADSADKLLAKARGAH